MFYLVFKIFGIVFLMGFWIGGRVNGNRVVIFYFCMVDTGLFSIVFESLFYFFLYKERFGYFFL